MKLLTSTARPRGRPVRLPPRCRAVQPSSRCLRLRFLPSLPSQPHHPHPNLDFANADTADLTSQAAARLLVACRQLIIFNTMSVASTVTDSATGREVGASTTASSKEVVVPLSATPNVIHTFETIVGECPDEEATWVCNPRSCIDRRHLCPLSLRYTASRSSAELSSRRGAIRQAIWDVVADEMRTKNWQDSLPSIVFDEDHLDVDKPGGCVDVVFSTSRLWSKMYARMELVRVEVKDGAPVILSRQGGSIKLSGNVLPVDLIRLPLTPTNSSALFMSLGVMVSNIGTAMGLATFTHKGSDKTLTYGVDGVRLYIKLHDSSMTLPFDKLVAQIPTHFLWKGVPITMYYSGRILHKTPLYSAKFPMEDEPSSSDGQNNRSPTSPSVSASNHQSSTAGASNEQASKRRRSDE